MDVITRTESRQRPVLSPQFATIVIVGLQLGLAIGIHILSWYIPTGINIDILPNQNLFDRSLTFSIQGATLGAAGVLTMWVVFGGSRLYSRIILSSAILSSVALSHVIFQRRYGYSWRFTGNLLYYGAGLLATVGVVAGIGVWYRWGHGWSGHDVQLDQRELEPPVQFNLRDLLAGTAILGVLFGLARCSSLARTLAPISWPDASYLSFSAGVGVIFGLLSFLSCLTILTRLPPIRSFLWGTLVAVAASIGEVFVLFHSSYWEGDTIWIYVCLNVTGYWWQVASLVVLRRSGWRIGNTSNSSSHASA